MWQIESHTSLGWRCTSACMSRRRIICLSCVHRSLKLLNDSFFVPPAAIYSLFHGFSLIRTAVTPSLSLDQRHGTCSKTICVSRTCKLTVFVVHWRRFFLISIRRIGRIRGVFATMRYINWHLHLQGLSTPDLSLSPTHLSIKRGRTTTTHYTHHQVSLMMSRNTTLVPSLGLRIGQTGEAGLSTGMRKEHVSPQIRKKEKEYSW